MSALLARDEGLERFVRAQDDAGTYAAALRELRAGRKVSHWMWFVFPQIAGLGRSPAARHYAIADLPEAQAYVAHPVLGPRLHECAGTLLTLPATGADEVFGSLDAMKLHSSMTLFARAEPGARDFPAVLDLWFEGREDEGTTSRLAEERRS